MTESKKVYTVTEMSEATGLSKSSILGYITSGEIASQKCGYMHTVSADEVKKFLALRAELRMHRRLGRPLKGLKEPRTS